MSNCAGSSRLFRRWIKIKDKPAGLIRVVGLAIPWMQLDGGDLRKGRKALGTVNLEIGFTVAGDLNELQKVRDAGHGVALKESLPLNALRGADHRARATSQMHHHPVGYGFEVACKVEFRHERAVFVFRPQRLIRMRDHNPHHYIGPGIGRRRVPAGRMRGSSCARLLQRRLRRAGGFLGFDIDGRFVLA